jgi:hypothetical protein
MVFKSVNKNVTFTYDDDPSIPLLIFLEGSIWRDSADPETLNTYRNPQKPK